MNKSESIGFLTANKLREDLKIPEKVAVNFKYITEKLMIKVRHGDLGSGIEGACKSQGLKRLIILKNNPSSLQKERFTLSHEIGHLIIHHGLHLCQKEYFYTYNKLNGKEREANDFAVELLLPKKEMLGILRNNDFTFELIKEVANKYDTSLSVAAIQLIQMFNDNAAIIWHDGQNIIWKVLSDDCVFNILNIISPCALAHRITAEKRNIKGKIDSQHWVDNEDTDIICEEESHYFSNLKQYFTILKFYDDY